MKFFIDTANINEIQKGVEMGMVDGVTTNPSLIAKENKPFEEIITEICRIVDGPIALLPCLSKISYRRCADCLDEATCEIRHVFAHVAESSRDILDNTSLLDAMTGRDPGRKRLVKKAKPARS